MNTKTFLFTSLLAVLLAACGRESSAPSPDALPRATVRVQAVELQPFVATEEAAGTVRPKLRSSVESKIIGRIDSLPVVQGQRVRAGDLLAQLDVRESQAKLDHAVAARDQAERDFNRFSELLRQAAVTQSEFETVESRLRMARAATAEAEVMLAHSKITAPFDGIVARKLADPGDLAVPGKPLLELEDPTSFRFEADVPEAHLARLRIGTKYSLRIPALEKELDAIVAEIGPAADALSRTIVVKFDLTREPELRSGLFGRVAIPLGETQMLRVPLSAVLQRGQLETVFVASGERAQLRLIRTGKRFADQVEILSGLDPGEQIVVGNLANLVDGQPLEIHHE